MKTVKTILVSIMMMATTALFAQEMKIDVKKSTLKWHGEKVTGDHYGVIDLKEGWMAMEDNRITQGEFLIDMTTIVNHDVEDEGYRAKLENHLKSDDFFGVASYPTAKLVIVNGSKFNDNEARIRGDLTIKGTTHPIEFQAFKKGNKYMADIVVDRSKYNVRYGSGSFFDNLGDNLIYDDFTLSVEIVPENVESAVMD